MTKRPNHAHLTRHGVVVCNRSVPWAGSLSSYERSQVLESVLH
jgi:hypothetical protein